MNRLKTRVEGRGARIVWFFAILLLPLHIFAQNKITASVTITNSTVNGLTFTVNGDTRTFTNNVVNSATQVLTNADATGCGSKTNLLSQIRATPFSQVVSVDTGSNTFNLVGNSGLAMSVSLSGTYGKVSYTTQTVAQLIALVGPVSAIPTAVGRTNVASDIVGGINAPENTNQISQIATAAAQLVGTTNVQAITGKKLLTNTNNQIWGIITSLGISGNSVFITNGVYFTPILSSPNTTNLVNYGNAISSPGTNADGSEQFGLNALALHGSLAVGPSAKATNNGNVAVGPFAFAQGQFTIAIGRAPTAFGDNTIVIGSLGAADGPNDIALGNLATAIGFSNATVIGYLAAATDNNQIMLGSPGISTVIQNNAKVQTNLTVGGYASIGGNTVVGGNFSASGLTTNIWAIGQNTLTNNADIAFVRKAVSSLINGGNAAVPIGTNVFVEVSGPTGAFSINGIANGRDGKMIIICNRTGQTMTIANASGTDPTPSNRILTGTGADVSLATNPGMATLIYSGAASNWLLMSHN